MTLVRRTIEKSLLINHPPAAIWEVLADFGGVAKWAPRMKGSRVSNGLVNGVGSRRVMRHVWGFRIEETVTHWEEGRSFTFRLDRAPPVMRDVSETWSIEGVAEGTLVRNRVTYGAGWALLGKAADAALIHVLVGREMTTSLRCLKHFADYRFGNDPQRA